MSALRTTVSGRGASTDTGAGGPACATDSAAACQVVQLASLGNDIDAELAARYRVLRWQPGTDAAPDARQVCHAQVAVTSVRQGFTSEMLGAMPALRAVCSWGVGYETLDVAAAAARGVMVSNTPGVLDDCVADLAWALLLTAARRTAVGDRYVKGGLWRSIGAFPLSTRVSRKRLGILGLGRIGMAIARRGAGFDMTVRYHGRRPRTDVPYEYMDSLRGLADWADFLVVACPGGPATRHLVDASVLRALGPAGILVNIARGSVVDEAALVAALRSGELGGAGLDVLEHEPAVPSAFRGMDQLALMPHVGSATRETRADMARLVFDNVVSYFETGRLLTPVDGAGA
jgi:lactate dehydrogenase-like 2-hydroxyacid dehydrogenase